MEPVSRARAADRPIEPGVTLGRYEILHRIASGGMATVFLARATGVGGFARLVAIKVCHPHLRDDEQFTEMFLHEARVAARIHHPNVVATLDVGHADGLYLVMDYVEGEPLSRLLHAASRAKKRIPTAIGLRILLDGLAGLHAAHELRGSEGPLGLVHRDVSPQNLMVGTDGRALIVDFGLAKATSRTPASRDGSLKGKLAYMAPEQFSGGAVTRQVDVYAAGVMAWETLTGERLHAYDTDSETIHSILHETPEPPSHVGEGVPAGLDAAILRALEREPSRRFATAADFADAIERSGVPIASAREVSAYVNSAMGDSLSERRVLVESLTRTEGIPHEVAQSRVAPIGPSSGPSPSPGFSSVSDFDSAATRVVNPPRTASNRRGLVIALVAIALGIGGVGGAAIVHSRSAASSSANGVSQPTPTAPPVANVPRSVAPPVAPVASGIVVDAGVAPLVVQPSTEPAANATAEPPAAGRAPVTRTHRSRTASGTGLYVPGRL